ncbi:hypothetical protein KUTeg_006930 [Tegillarca granosa]|uniref:Major facilitator superfamily (MFS) profile domain-containing protein n=1 Tax=Tegillarca granosa TaxID=220873 RepID=A0ABQ9FBR3_TEGGR|nr:hypothetical protein KUTeg_006930 [Tegillarca granosa]
MLMNGIIFSIINTFGIIYARMVKENQQSVQNVAFKTSWVGSVNIGVLFSMSFAPIIIKDRIGLRSMAIFGAVFGSSGLILSGFVIQLEYLYVTFGIMLGIGMAFLYNPSLIILADYFDRRIGLANGLVTFGSALFSVVMSLVLPIVLSHFGVKYTLISIGVLFFTLIFPALTFKPLQKENAKAKSSPVCRKKIIKILCKTTVWKNKTFVIWVLLLGLMGFGVFIPAVHMVKHSKDNFADYNADLLITVMQISSGASRLIFGRISDIKSFNRIYMQQIALFVYGVGTSCIPFINNFILLAIVAGILGVGDGIIVLLVGPIIFDIVGPTYASEGIGWFFVIATIPVLLGPPTAGIYIYFIIYMHSIQNKSFRIFISGPIGRLYCCTR